MAIPGILGHAKGSIEDDRLPSINAPIDIRDGLTNTEATLVPSTPTAVVFGAFAKRLES